MESQKKYWNIDPASGALLQSLIHTHKPKHILEVGTSNGYSAILMGQVAKKYNGHITTIEFFEERVKLARENIVQEKLETTIEVMQGDAMELLPTLGSPQSPSVIPAKAGIQANVDPRVKPEDDKNKNTPSTFDFIFLDAAKEEHADYFKLSMQLMPNGGIIVADNTISHHKKLLPFFEAVQNEPRADALELSIGSGLMVITITQ